MVLVAIDLFVLGWNTGNLLGEWSVGNSFEGFAGIVFSFLMDVIILRCNWIIKNKLGMLGLSVLLLLAFRAPNNDQWNGLVDPVIIVFYFPLLVSLGAGATLSNKYSRINKFSGDILYPLYMTHYPFMWVFTGYVVVEELSMAELSCVIPICLVLIMGLAYLVSVFLDFSLRHYFTTKMRTKASRNR